MSHLTDASDQTAEHNDAALHDLYDSRDDWADDERPDPWECGPVHHPTRFDLPVPAEPPF